MRTLLPRLPMYSVGKNTELGEACRSSKCHNAEVLRKVDVHVHGCRMRPLSSLTRRILSGRSEPGSFVDGRSLKRAEELRSCALRGTM